MTDDDAQAGADGARPVDPSPAAPEVTVVDVAMGRKVMVVSDLLLTATATPSSTAVSEELARALDSWNGPGVLVIAGNLLDLTDDATPIEQAERAMAAHPRLAEAIRQFSDGDERRVIRQTGTHEPGLDHDPATVAAMQAFGVEPHGPVDLHLQAGDGTHVVRVDPGEDAYATDTDTDTDTGTDAGAGATADADAGSPGPSADTKPGGLGAARDPSPLPALTLRSQEDAPWFAGIDRLSDPSAVSRFVTSRTLYRRFGRFAWWLLVPFVVALALRFLLPDIVVNHVGSSLPGRAIRSAHTADWEDRMVISALFVVIILAVLALVVGLLSRRIWSVLGGGALVSIRTEAWANDRARDSARQLLADDRSGLITAATFQPELTNLGVGFYANVGATAEVVEEHRGRFGLPPVFIHRRRVSWVELETGATLHARLLVAESDLSSPSLMERMVCLDRAPGTVQPVVVASYPSGDSWPPAPDLRSAHRHTRRVRRVAAAAILAAGIIDLLDAVTPPIRARLHLVLDVLPFQATQAAGALVALAGMALIALGRGILRGQRRAWRVSVVLLAGSIVLHLAAGGDFEETLIALAVLAVLLVNRHEFQAASDWASLRSAVVVLVGGAVAIAAVATASVEVYTHTGHRHDRIGWAHASWAVSERLAGIRTIALPRHLDNFLAPSLLVIGLTLVGIALFLLSRPVVDRRLSSGRVAEYRARDIVRRHGRSTLDYFALRSDKRWFFHRDSLVAYAIYGGICLISPDPIGPANERAQVWSAFRRFADSHGWVTSVVGAGEDWLPYYAESGMHHVYIGDEAVVDVQRFSLAGGDKKGLRQAHNRIGNKGYTATFHDPTHIDRDITDKLIELMGLSRQGEHERGFSMMLGRVFDPRDTGLLLTVVWAPDGRPAAMCQFVPAPAIRGFSLDLMRRDPAEHPNGLLDFALCSTIEHLRAQGFGGLSLNFAAMRSTLSGEKGDSPVQRSARWALKRMSSFVQIESLWKFNAKYDPTWLPRYVIFDAPEHLVPVVTAILRAESLWEVPIIGRLLAVGAERRMEAAREETEAARDAVEVTGDEVGTGGVGTGGTEVEPEAEAAPDGLRGTA